MSQTQDTVTVPAAELQQVLTTADAGLKKYAAQVAELEKELAEFKQKQAADAAVVKEATAAAVDALVKNKIIREDEAVKAAGVLSTLAGALGVLAKTANVADRAPRPIGKAESKQKTASERGGRATDQPEVRAEVNDNYLAALGIGQ